MLSNFTSHLPAYPSLRRPTPPPPTVDVPAHPSSRAARPRKRLRSRRHHPHHSPGPPGQPERHKTPDPVCSSAVNPRIPCVRQGPGSGPSFMINRTAARWSRLIGRIYPERAGLPAPAHPSSRAARLGNRTQATRHHPHHGPGAPGQPERHETLDPMRSSAMNPRIQRVQQRPGSRPSFMINSNGGAPKPADGRIYPERAGLPAPGHHPRAPMEAPPRARRGVSDFKYLSPHKKRPVVMFLMR